MITTKKHLLFQHLTNSKLRIAYFLFFFMRFKKFMKFCGNLMLYFSRFNFPFWLPIKKTLFEHFCGGENLYELKHIIQNLKATGVKICFSYSIEGKNKSLHNIDNIFRENQELINIMPKNNFVALKLSGIISSSILIKIQNNETLTTNEKKIFSHFKYKLNIFLEEAKKKDISIMIDAEESWFQDTIDTLCLELMKKFNTKNAVIFTTIQMYRKDKLEYLKKITAQAKQENFQLAIKLVRGAYVEKELEYSIQQNKENLLFNSKKLCDNDYNEALNFIFENLDYIYIFAGTHNIQSIKLFSSLYENLNKNRHKAIASQLYGMADYISYDLLKKNIPICKYIPYGPIKEVIPYLIRRMEENSSVLDSAQIELTYIKEEKNRRKLIF